MTDVTAATRDRTPTPAGIRSRMDRTTAWFVALVFAATAAAVGRAAWWSWHLDDVPEGHSTWEILHSLVFVVGQRAWVRWVLVGCAALAALVALAVVLQRTWGVLLALVGSVSLIACTLLARYLAVLSEPRQYVARSSYVHAATVVALVTLAGHGAAAIAGVRWLCRTPARLGLVRITLGVCAVLVAVGPVLWISEHRPGGVRNAVMVWSCAAAALAALIAGCVPRRWTVRGAIAVSLAALIALAIGLAVQLNDRPRRGGLYSRAAEQALCEVAFMAPLVVGVVGACLVLRRHRPWIPG